jgi:hypothetical protein
MEAPFSTFAELKTKNMDSKTMTDLDKELYIEEKLTLSGLVPIPIRKHFKFRITHPDPEITRLSYQVDPKILNQRQGLSTAIFNVITEAAQEVNIGIVNTI